MRHALAQYCDITSPVRKKMFPKLAQYASDPKERERLYFLASPEGREEFMSWVSVPGRTSGERRRAELDCEPTEIVEARAALSVAREAGNPVPQRQTP